MCSVDDIFDHDERIRERVAFACFDFNGRAPAIQKRASLFSANLSGELPEWLYGFSH